MSVPHRAQGLLVLALLGVLTGAPCRAGGEPSTFVEKLATGSISALESKAPPADKRRALGTLVAESFALAVIAEQLLGERWAEMAPAMRADFIAALRRLIVAETIQRFRDYRPGSFRVVGRRAIGGGDELVGTRFHRASGAERDVQWRVANRGGRWVIVDVLEFGASMTIAKRDEYRAVLRRPQATIQTLIDLMNAQSERLEQAL
jgi:phospholipid transport system substrate-binding protein